MFILFLHFIFQGTLKEKTTENLEKYVHRDDRLPILLKRFVRKKIKILNF